MYREPDPALFVEHERMRIVAGNTGGTDIGMFRRLPIERELAQLLDADK